MDDELRREVVWALHQAVNVGYFKSNEDWRRAKRALDALKTER